MKKEFRIKKGTLPEYVGGKSTVMDAADGIDLLFRGSHFHVGPVAVVILVQIQQRQKFNEFLVDDQIPHGVTLLGQEKNIVEFAIDLLPQLQIKAEDGDALMKQAQKQLVFIGKAGDDLGQVELNDEPLAGISAGILGAVQNIGPETDDIEGLQLIGHTL